MATLYTLPERVESFVSHVGGLCPIIFLGEALSSGCFAWSMAAAGRDPETVFLLAVVGFEYDW